MVKYDPSYGRGKYFLIFNYSSTGLPCIKPSIAFSNYRKVTGLAYDISEETRVRGGSYRSLQKVSRYGIFIIFWSLTQNAPPPRKFSTTIPERLQVGDGQTLARWVGVLLELLLPSDKHPQVYIPIWRQRTHKPIYTVRRLRIVGVSKFRICKH